MKMATRSRRSLANVNNGSKPFVGRRTGKVIEINARLDAHGYERISDYFPDTDSDSENDISIPQSRKPEPVGPQDTVKENIDNSELNISKRRKQQENSKSGHAAGKSGGKNAKSVVQPNRSECSPDSAMGSTDCDVDADVPSPPIDAVEDKLVSSPEKPVSSPDKPVSSPDKPVSSPDKPVPSPDKQVSSPDKQVSSPDKGVSSPDKQVSSPDKPVSSPDRPVSSPDKRVSSTIQHVPSTKRRTTGTGIPPASMNYSDNFVEESSPEENANPGSARKKLRFSLYNTSFTQEETRLDIENSLITAKQTNDPVQDEYELITDGRKDVRSTTKKNTAKSKKSNKNTRDGVESIENVNDLRTQEVCKSNDTFLTLRKNPTNSIREKLFRTLNDNSNKTITVHDTPEDPQISRNNTGVSKNPEPSPKNVYLKNKSSSKAVTIHDTPEDPQISRNNTGVSKNPQPSPKEVSQKNKSSSKAVTLHDTHEEPQISRNNAGVPDNPQPSPKDVYQKLPENDTISTNAPNTQNTTRSKIPVRKMKTPKLTFRPRRKPSPRNQKASEGTSPPKARYRKTPAGKNVLGKAGKNLLREAETVDADEIEVQEDDSNEVDDNEDGVVGHTAIKPQGVSELPHSKKKPVTTNTKNSKAAVPELQRNKPSRGKRATRSTRQQDVTQNNVIESEEDQPPVKKTTTRRVQTSTKKGSKVPVSSRSVNRTRGNATRKTPIPNKDSNDIEELEDPNEASTMIPDSNSTRKTYNIRGKSAKPPLPTRDSDDIMNEGLEVDIPGNSNEETTSVQVLNRSARNTRSSKESDLPTKAKEDASKNPVSNQSAGKTVDEKAPSKKRGRKAKDATGGVADPDEIPSTKHTKETVKKKTTLKTRSKKNVEEAILNEVDPGQEDPDHEDPGHESLSDFLESRFNSSAGPRGNQSSVNSVQRSGMKTGLTTQDGSADELEHNSEVNLQSVVKYSNRKAPVSSRRNLRSGKANETAEKSVAKEHDDIESTVKKSNTRNGKTKVGKNTRNSAQTTSKVSPNVSRESIEDESDTTSIETNGYTAEPLPSAPMPSPPPVSFSPTSEDESVSGKEVSVILDATETRSNVSRKRKLVVDLSKTEDSAKKAAKAAGKRSTATKTRKTNSKSQGKDKARTGQATTTKNSRRNSERSSGFSSDDEATGVNPTFKTTGNSKVFHDTIGTPVSTTSSEAEDVASTIKAPRNKKKGAVKLDSVSRTNVEENESEEGPRRSQRNRVPCLQYWRNDRIEYERRDSGWVVKDVIVNPTPAPIRLKRRAHERQQGKAKSTRPRAKKAMRSTESGESDWSDIDFSDEMTKETDPIATVIDPETMKEVEMKLLQSGRNVELRSPTSSQDASANADAPLLLDKCFSQGKFGAGEILLRPGAEKGRQHVRRDTMIFYVVSGRVLVSIHNQSFTLTKGSKFFVPQGNVYNLKNLDTKRDARLFFSQIKD